MKDVWLCGASECLDFEESNTWRKECKEWFKSNSKYFRAVNPNDYYNYSECLHKSELEIVKFCLRKVRKSKVILVNLNNIRLSVGSIVEVAWAYLWRKPIIGFLERNDVEENEVDKLKKIIHPWIYCFCDRIELGENSMEEAILYIEKYYNDKEK